MELNLLDVAFDLTDIKPRELEEALGDPFGLRLIPEDDEAARPSRYYLLARTISDRHLFICFSTDGKTARIITAREQTETEQRFYERKYAEIL